MRRVNVLTGELPAEQDRPGYTWRGPSRLYVVAGAPTLRDPAGERRGASSDLPGNALRGGIRLAG